MGGIHSIRVIYCTYRALDRTLVLRKYLGADGGFNGTAILEVTATIMCVIIRMHLTPPR